MQPSITLKNQEPVSVTIIIVTYNSEATISDCLNSLSSQTFQGFDVVLVDNFSQDTTRAVIASAKKSLNFALKTTYLKENKGFAYGNNVALKETSASLIALLNPDAKAHKNWLHHLVTTMGQYPEVGICGSKLLTWDGDMIDSAGDIMLTTLRAFKGGEGQRPQDFNSSGFAFGACAAGAIYRRQMIEEIGFFDEDFFYQCEDTDLSIRCQVAGWKIFFQHKALVYHRVGHSIGRASDTGTYYVQRNLEFVRIKNIPLPILFFFAPQMIIGFLVDFLHLCIKRGMFGVFFKAKYDAIKMAPAMIKKRAVIMRRLKKVSNGYLFSIISPLSKNKYLIRYKLKALRQPRAKGDKLYLKSLVNAKYREIKKIVYLSGTTLPGGGPEHLFQLIKRINLLEWKPVICTRNDGSYWEKFCAFDIRLHELSLRKLSLFSAFRLLQILREEQPDLIHTHGKGPGLYGRILGKILGTPVIHTFHGFHYETIPILTRWIHLLADNLLSIVTHQHIFVSMGEKERARVIKFLDEKNSTIIHNGVDYKYIQNLDVDQKAILKLIGCEDWGGNKILGTISRLSPEKGILDLLSGFSLAIQSEPNLKLIIVGGYPEEYEYYYLQAKALIERKHLEEHVRILGYRQDALKILKCMNYFILPSLSEGLPLSLLEAAAAKVPAIATKISGNKDILCHECPYIGVQAGCPENLKTLHSSLPPSAKTQKGFSSSYLKRSLQKFLRSTPRFQTTRAFHSKGKESTESPICHSSLGVLSNPNSPKSLAQGIRAMLAFSDRERDILSQNTFSHVKENFSVAVMADETFQLYRQTLNKTKAQKPVSPSRI